MDYICIGQNIRTERKKCGITQEYLAELCNITPVFVSQIENGMRKPSLETMYSISKSLGVSVDDLLRQYPAPEIQVDRFISLLSERSPQELEYAYRLLCCALENLDNGKIEIKKNHPEG
ncbi:MAG: helix-turn-helix domain-containing protein [Candidatus Fimenecus sp.]